MRTYKEILTEIETLKVEAEAARKREFAGAKEQIHKIMQEHGLELADLDPVNRSSKATKAKSTIVQLYRDPDSGKTWSGRGRTPLWMNGKEREAFLIK